MVIFHRYRKRPTLEPMVKQTSSRVNTTEPDSTHQQIQAVMVSAELESIGMMLMMFQLLSLKTMMLGVRSKQLSLLSLNFVREKVKEINSLF